MFFYISSLQKYGVIVQNGAQTLKIHIWLVDIMTLASTLVAPNAYHDSTLQHLQDAERVTSMHRAHPPPTAA